MAAASKKSIVAGRSVMAEYDFAVLGGAISDIDLRVTIPNGAIIVGGLMDVLTVPVGVGASIAVRTEAAGDIVAAAAISGAPWSTTGLKAIIPVFTAATAVKMTADRALKISVTGAALTAGKFRVYLKYFLHRG